ncbi:MAG: DNA repair protein RadA [Patescibacteria group bacterium]|nr:DNA repair protein RadA [Patescibacteria group bacterium]
MGKCPECGLWNTLREIKIPTSAKASAGRQNSMLQTRESLVPHKLSEINYEEGQRVLTGFSEMDEVLGGGIVNGSVILLAGDPGVGKSTLLLQMALKLSGDSAVSRQSRFSNDARSSFPKKQSQPRSLSESRLPNSKYNQDKKASAFNSLASGQSTVLYISGEESEQQIKLRAQRISKNKTSELLLLSLTNTDEAINAIAETKPSLVIVDSIQTMESENLTGLSGSVGQVRYAALQFIRAAKTMNIPVILVGHVTKEGMVAGPMVLSHMVDTVLFLEGEKTTGTRLLRGLKNRFGPVDEVGVFSMQDGGISEVKNPEQVFLNENRDVSPGSVLVITLEGSRAFLVEIQALVVFSKLPMPRRVASGFDYKRLELLLAVLQKHVRLPVDTMDVFVNVAGGLKLQDPAADLGICLAIFSSLKNVSLKKVVAVGEVGLLGELRSIPSLEKRVKEARKLGFNKIITPANYKSIEEVVRILTKQ